MRRKKIFYSLLVLVILASGGVWAYLNVNLGFNEIRFVRQDLEEGLLFLQTGNCEAWGEFGGKKENCQDIIESEGYQVRDFSITAKTKSGDRYYTSVDLQIQDEILVLTAQLVNKDGR